MEKRKARKLTPEELSQKRKVKVKNQKLAVLRKRIRLVLIIGIVALAGYMLLGVIGSGEYDTKQEVISSKSIPEVKIALNNLPVLLYESGSADNVILNGSPGQLSWTEEFGEGVLLHCSAYWEDFNQLKVTLDSANIDCEAEWNYTLSKADSGTKIILNEKIDMNNVGYKAYLFLNSYLVNLEDINSVIDGE